MVYVPPGVLGGGGSCSSLEGADVPPMLPSVTFVCSVALTCFDSSSGIPWECISTPRDGDIRVKMVLVRHCLQGKFVSTSF